MLDWGTHFVCLVVFVPVGLGASLGAGFEWLTIFFAVNLATKTHVHVLHVWIFRSCHTVLCVFENFPVLKGVLSHVWL